MKKIYLLTLAVFFLALPAYGDELTGIPGLELGCKISIQSIYQKTAGVDGNMSLELSEAELNFGYTPNDRVRAAINFLSEANDLIVDEAYFGFAPGLKIGDGEVTFLGGHMTVPFGEYSTDMVSDPITLEIGEISNDTISLGWSNETASAEIYVFSGEVNKNEKEGGLDAVVVRVSGEVAPELYLSGSLTSDLFESKAELVDDQYSLNEELPAVDLYAEYKTKDFVLRGELLSALKPLNDETVAQNTKITGKRPMAWTAEVAYKAHEVVTLTSRYEKSDGVLDNLKRCGLTAAWAVEKFMNVSAEYIYTGHDRQPDEHQTTIQVALTF